MGPTALLIFRFEVQALVLGMYVITYLSTHIYLCIDCRYIVLNTFTLHRQVPTLSCRPLGYSSSLFLMISNLSILLLSSLLITRHLNTYLGGTDTITVRYLEKETKGKILLSNFSFLIIGFQAQLPTISLFLPPCAACRQGVFYLEWQVLFQP